MKIEYKHLFQATLYFKKEHFKTSIPVAITAMLVMYTLNNSISSKLPQTSSFKFMDLWILFGLFSHFLIPILLILIEHIPPASDVVFIDKEQKLTQEKLGNSKHRLVKVFAQKILPNLQITFTLTYFTLGCYFYLNTDY